MISVSQLKTTYSNNWELIRSRDYQQATRQVLGFRSAYDGGHGTFVYNSNNSNAHDGGVFINRFAPNPSSNLISYLNFNSNTGPGRWIRITDDSKKVNVKWFGAFGNGIEDDKQSFTAALNYLNSIGGGILYLPSGTYLFNKGNIIIPDNITICGEGIDDTIIKLNDNVAGQITTRNDFIRGKPNNFVMKDLTLEGSYGEGGIYSQCSHLLFFSRTQSEAPYSNIRFDNVRITKSRFMAIVIIGGESITVSKCKFSFSRSSGLRLISSRDITITNNTWQYVFGDSIAILSDDTYSMLAENIVISYNIIEDSHGITCHGIKSTVITNNVLKRPYNFGIQVLPNQANNFGQTPQHNIIIANNVINDTILISGSSANYFVLSSTPVRGFINSNNPTNGDIFPPYGALYLSNVVTNSNNPAAGNFFIKVDNNVLTRTLQAVSNYSSWGFGSFWNIDSGFSNTPITEAQLAGSNQRLMLLTNTGYVISITDNILHGVERQISINGVVYDNVMISGNQFVDFTNALEIASFKGSLTIRNNSFDGDPYFRLRNKLLLGGWSNANSCIAINNLSSISQHSYDLCDNTFRNVSSIQNNNGFMVHARNNVSYSSACNLNIFSSNNLGVGTPLLNSDQFQIVVQNCNPYSSNYGTSTIHPGVGTFFNTGVSQFHLHQNLPYSPFTTTHRRYAEILQLDNISGICTIKGALLGHTLGNGGICSLDICVHNRSGERFISGSVTNFGAFNQCGVVIYRNTVNGNFHVYITGRDFFRYFLTLQSSVTPFTPVLWSSDSLFVPPITHELWLDTTLYQEAVSSVIYVASPSNSGFSQPVLSVATNNTLRVGGHILPASNLVYDLGSTNQRFRDLYLSGDSLFLSNTRISATSNNVLTFSDLTSNPSSIRANELVIGSNAKPITLKSKNGNLSIDTPFGNDSDNIINVGFSFLNNVLVAQREVILPNQIPNTQPVAWFDMSAAYKYTLSNQSSNVSVFINQAANAQGSNFDLVRTSNSVPFAVLSNNQQNGLPMANFFLSPYTCDLASNINQELTVTYVIRPGVPFDLNDRTHIQLYSPRANSNVLTSTETDITFIDRNSNGIRYLMYRFGYSNGPSINTGYVINSNNSYIITITRSSTNGVSIWANGSNIAYRVASVNRAINC